MKEFGNTDLIEYLRDNTEMQNARQAMAEEDRENPFFADTIQTLLNVIKPQTSSGNRLEADPDPNSSYIASLKKLLSENTGKQLHESLFNFLRGLPTSNEPSGYKWSAIPNDLGEIKANLKSHVESNKDDTLARDVEQILKNIE